MKRFSFIYKGDKILGDSAEAIAFRVVKAGDKRDYQEILDQVNAELFQNKENIPVSRPPSNIKKPLTLNDYINGAKAVVKVVSGEVADQSEINRRAIICTNCPNKTEIPGCRGCGFTDTLNRTVNGLKKMFGKGFNIPNGLQGNGCDVCGCALSVMLPSKMEQFNEKLGVVRPTNCWINKQSPNYIP